MQQARHRYLLGLLGRGLHERRAWLGDGWALGHAVAALQVRFECLNVWVSSCGAGLQAGAREAGGTGAHAAHVGNVHVHCTHLYVALLRLTPDLFKLTPDVLVVCILRRRGWLLHSHSSCRMQAGGAALQASRQAGGAAPQPSRQAGVSGWRVFIYLYSYRSAR